MKNAARLLAMGTLLLQAQTQEPSPILRIFREDIKPGKGGAHQKVESAYARAFARAGFTNYVGLESMTGVTQAWFVELYRSYQQMEKAIRLQGTEPLKSAIAPLDPQDAELRTGESGMIANYQKNLSYLPDPSNLGKARYIAVNTIRVRPGRQDDFLEMRKLLHAAWAKGGFKEQITVYSVNSGAPGGTYLAFRAMDSLKAMDELPAMSMADAFGPENRALYIKFQSEIIVGTESTLFAINPKMSNPTKEWVAASPDFWK